MHSVHALIVHLNWGGIILVGHYQAVSTLPTLSLTMDQSNVTKATHSDNLTENDGVQAECEHFHQVLHISGMSSEPYSIHSFLIVVRLDISF